jgi:hypothetical protein
VDEYELGMPLRAVIRPQERSSQAGREKHKIVRGFPVASAVLWAVKVATAN